MKFFNARRTAYRTNPRQIDDVIYTTYSYGPQDPPLSAVPDENNALSSGGRLGGGRGLRRGAASGKWRSSGSDGETTTATAVETPNLEAAHTGAPAATTVSAAETVTGDLLGVPELAASDGMVTATPPTATVKRKGSKWDAVGTGDAEIFLFLYGTVVIWGMTEQQEKRFLSSL